MCIRDRYLNALEEYEIYKAYNDASTKPHMLNDQLQYKSNILLLTVYGPVSYTHLDVYKRQHLCVYVQEDDKFTSAKMGKTARVFCTSQYK